MPNTQKTFSLLAPLISLKYVAPATVRVVCATNIHFGFVPFCPSSVTNVVVIPRVPEQYTPNI